MNSGSGTVYTSPIKRLLSVNFISGGVNTSSRQTSRTRQADDNRPSYVTTIEEGLTKPYTARVCNDDIDVVHFNLVVITDIKAVLSFMDELSSAKEHIIPKSDKEQNTKSKHNQITILESKIDSIDRAVEEHNLYRYGKEPAVVKIELVCEYIFNKSGYDKIKPESVKESLKKPEEDTSRRRRPALAPAPAPGAEPSLDDLLK